MTRLALLCLLTSLLQPCFSYVDLSPVETTEYIPRVSVPGPWQIPPDEYMSYPVLPSMITAVVPSTTMASNGSLETMYSMHHHDYFVRSRRGAGIFKRGVFASDPPIPTCTPCGLQGTSSPVNGTGATTGTQTLSCTLHTYLGVFRSPVGAAASSTSVCYDSNYSGALASSTTSASGLPCCFSIPASCRSNASMSMSYTYTTGVFRSSTTMSFLSNFTMTTASPSSSSSLGTVSSTTSFSNSSSVSLSSLSFNSTTFTSSSTSSSSKPVSSPSSSSAAAFSTALPLSRITSVTVVSSSTITVVVTRSSSSSSSGRYVAAPVTLSVITAFPNGANSLIVHSIVETVPNTVEGCGTASGSGEVIGTGTVYVAGGFGVVSSGTVSGYANKVVGCGTLIATSGSFSGSATIIGCGTGSGSGILDGTGTVYPAALGGMIGITSSGRITGSGLVIGCGTIVGTGTFTATVPYTTTIYQTLAPDQGTVEVYVSYCPTIGAENGLPRLADNNTSPALVPDVK